ncbi:deazaflavin-dependent oxidoreductase, nitroreductase family [Nocardioides alpinus]|uniref:Deazaflavin-dependent oxidoreductase, nitroreductase family n=1 Tax=Nocardioides alpinus TaxID=748909 RepID=A0A1I0Y203_9ACTN|nr:nitroreductase family deazaflavin-dependent oxidoreductase [Nocardioides alpinus]PKH42697.1 nitroreductase family deazaflavin-dependent oxidoreductase [Nocardioides alpinus]SFB07379.1 deazaflavin-dependent oxidoreductase, nitroreductase family [Nocardioides alpinus]
MGLASDLDYSHSSANPLHRFVRWAAGTRPGGWVFAHSLRHLDDVVVRLSRGRHSAPSLLAGLAVLEVTTTGRRSGQRRSSHLIATPYDDTLALLGTNFGQASTPAWVLNLEADPHATVTYRGTTREVTARAATPAETEEVFALAGQFYPGYLSYRQRVGGTRRIRAFVLTSPDAGRPVGP